MRVVGAGEHHKDRENCIPELLEVDKSAGAVTFSMVEAIDRSN